jgi:hypothetical protein
MRHLFCSIAAAALLVASPATAQSDDQAVLAEFQAAVEEMRAEMLRPGDYVEGWDEGGADPDAELRALGAASHYFLTRGSAGTLVGILTDRPIADFAPDGWRIVDSYGSGSTPLDSAQVDFMPLSARYVMATRTQLNRVNHVHCADNFAHALLFELPEAPEAAEDEGMEMMFRMMILALEDQMICVRSDGDPERGYRTRYFRPDGRELPGLTTGDEVSIIVPAAPVDQLIEAPPPAE